MHKKFVGIVGAAVVSVSLTATASYAAGGYPSTPQPTVSASNGHGSSPVASRTLNSTSNAGDNAPTSQVKGTIQAGNSEKIHVDLGDFNGTLPHPAPVDVPGVGKATAIAATTNSVTANVSFYSSKDDNTGKKVQHESKQVGNGASQVSLDTKSLDQPGWYKVTLTYDVTETLKVKSTGKDITRTFKVTTHQWVHVR